LLKRAAHSSKNGKKVKGKMVNFEMVLAGFKPSQYLFEANKSG
jgi:hypothetical protein